MSFDIFVQGLTAAATAEEVEAAAAGARAVLAPFLDAAGDRITTADGGAAIYGANDLGNGFMVNHASGELIWDVLVDVARATEFVILPVGCGTLIPYEGMRASVPDGFPRPIVLVAAGADLLAAIRSA